MNTQPEDVSPDQIVHMHVPVLRVAPVQTSVIITRTRSTVNPQDNTWHSARTPATHRIVRAV